MNRLRIGLALSFLGVVGGLLYGTLHVEQVTPGRHVRIAWDGGTPDGSVCVELDGLSSPQARALFGLNPDGGQQYARIRMGAYLADDDAGMPELPPGMLALEGSEVVLDGGVCPYRFEAWLPATDAPFPCACSTGSNCQSLASDGGWATAPTGVTLPEGRWKGAGCFPKVCTELLGSTSWPGVCP
jgi:hypothetical protein